MWKPLITCMVVNVWHNLPDNDVKAQNIKVLKPGMTISGPHSHFWLQRTNTHNPPPRLQEMYTNNLTEEAYIIVWNNSDLYFESINHECSKSLFANLASSQH